MAAVDEFVQHREHLLAVAYRMLGSRAEAEDVVQEAWLRFDSARRATDEQRTSAVPADAPRDGGVDPPHRRPVPRDGPGTPSVTGEILDPRGWLTTVTARICLDVLRSARIRREAYIGPWLPEPLIDRLPAGSGLTTLTGQVEPGSPEADPADRLTRLEDVSYALLAVLERLTPEQRVAFVLHDVFGAPFTEIADVLDTSDQAARQLASRARRAVTDGTPRRRAGLDEQRRVLAAFVAAAEKGDIDGLLAVLAPDAYAVGDGGGAVPAGRAPVIGAVKVARLMAALFRQLGRLRHADASGQADRLGQAGRSSQWRPVVIEPVLVNGDLGLLMAADFQGVPILLVMAFAIADGRITAIFDQINPAKLDRVPAPDPARNLFA